MNDVIRYKIWIDRNGKSFLGKGKVILLKELHELKSLNKAADRLNISYKKAWEMLKNLNENSLQPVTIQKVGGKNGGGTTLTEYGLQLIQTFERVDQRCKEFLQEEIKNHQL